MTDLKLLISMAYLPRCVYSFNAVVLSYWDHSWGLQEGLSSICTSCSYFVHMLYTYCILLENETDWLTYGISWAWIHKGPYEGSYERSFST